MIYITSMQYAKEFGIKLHEVNVDREDIEKRLTESIWKK